VEKGLVQIYTGDGKGKTTAALGLAMRAAGRGLSVFMIQFLKGRKYGELKSAERLSDRLTIVQSGLDSFVKKGEPGEEDLRLARRGLELAGEAIKSGDYDIVILDEVNVAVELGVLKTEDVLPLIEGRPGNVELVLTGRYAPPEFCERADLITEMKNVKHCYDAGVEMREGIEY
jgi:cob(I)alamin adenosyltransferase